MNDNDKVVDIKKAQKEKEEREKEEALQKVLDQAKKLDW